ncbi:DUF397 domain-containing protein [Kibdelosporangium phytohabitans]|uniref:DUF397 domain-containing protein n=1 Tax=Kibdelosporangium phytohabitans TaxID=860235 RepID=UPI0007C66AE8|nr:DUF397 domain-containing protein [Kibdelosporangium phytohabitans]MBE1464581.1 hypothetical protein [Kibdelosporangium phytohabitans]
MNTHEEWRTSTFSAPNNNCVQLAVSRDAARVRDSKNPGTGLLAFGSTEFTTFLTLLKR